MEDKSIGKKDLQNRLKRIEGQVKGIQNMLERDAGCKEVLIQIAAIRAAINKVGALILQNYAKGCFIQDTENMSEEKIDELIATLTMFMK
ncbi:metal-sensitive transcriptional regulator [Clostridium cochlearium]|uniref:Metal-sensitive transcriptional regulator n=1 Tax=Clostridium cochlearium TaxID=1494 RepID=A0A7Y3V6J8_CLOCO|nr:metal-sensitive transcriptional regulator [Clostridium cochlearium]MBE6064131.1 metal-sensitive transcriptional regulator [Clostridium cochlearium]NMA58585.1 metal-sensitive transcriptional regulator [Clostridium cochlearium]NOH15643.1 metal-sensitive transcriptional regulator [Clostridium cochlearium]